MGKQRIIGDFIKFSSETATNFYNIIYSKWESLIAGKKFLILIPCASTKPIQMSMSHCFLSPITRNYHQLIQLAIVSEPLTLIPYLEQEYPNYEYFPTKVLEDNDEKTLFIERLGKFKEKTKEINPDIKIFFLGSKHHKNMLTEAGWNFQYIYPKRGLLDYHKEAAKLHSTLLNYIDKFSKIKINTKFISKNLVHIEYQLINEPFH